MSYHRLFCCHSSRTQKLLPGHWNASKDACFWFLSDILVPSIFRHCQDYPSAEAVTANHCSEAFLFLELNPFSFLRSRLASPRLRLALSHTAGLPFSAPCAFPSSLNRRFLPFHFNFSTQPPVYYCKQLFCLLDGTGHPLASGVKAGGTEELWGHMATLRSLLYWLSAVAFSLLRFLHSPSTALTRHCINSTHVLFLFYDEYKLAISTATKDGRCSWIHQLVEND